MALPRTDIETAMRHALDLASRGPVVGGNPQVGCVLLDTSGAIVAEGWHRGAGTPHAEADALARLRTSLGIASDPAVSDSGHATGYTTGYAAGLTAVVTLEPYTHTGRTGPCAEALINAGVSDVYFAVSDPSHLAS
ncbi:MAG: ribD, partial [Glaciihabitans sp.]|nr:ribD [Glaciihabitans sp.]